MKKVLILMLALVVLISCVFVSCKGKTDDKETTSTTEGIDIEGDEFGFEVTNVTDENGKKVTDKDGKEVTTLAAVKYKTDKNGKTHAELIDSNGNAVTDKNGKPATIKVPDRTTDKGTTKRKAPANTDKLTTTTKPAPTATTNKDKNKTTLPSTTDFNGKDVVPNTSAKGKEVAFSAEDQEILKSMLEVPYLYVASYENADGVPISIAAHTAVWMAERDGGINSIYPSSPVVLNLFKYYGQTVVNFKTQCNKYAPDAQAPISYISKDDTFEITGYTSKKQNVTITKVEDLGNNNYYKVYGDVSNAKGKTKVVAIVQKNRLDLSLGFSVKALKWS